LVATAAARVAAAQDYRAAIPVLLRYAQRDLPSPVASALIREAEAQSPYASIRRLEQAEESLQLEAVDALGMLGASEALPVLRRLWTEAQASPEAATRVGLALVCLGDLTPLPKLVDLCADADRSVACGALNALWLLSGEGDAISLQASHARRQAAAAAVKQWWRRQGRKGFAPDLESIRRRRLERVPPRPPIPPRTVRDWLALAADPRNVSGDYNLLRAFRSLAALGERGLAPLEDVIIDEDHDVNVRVMAIRVYVGLKDGGGASGELKASRQFRQRMLKTLRRVRGDNDPEVRDLARRLADDLMASGR
jgi:hypothetical protein